VGVGKSVGIDDPIKSGDCSLKISVLKKLPWDHCLKGQCAISSKPDGGNNNTAWRALRVRQRGPDLKPPHAVARSGTLDGYLKGQGCPSDASGNRADIGTAGDAILMQKCKTRWPINLRNVKIRPRSQHLREYMLVMYASARGETMTDQNSNRANGAGSSSVSRNVQLHILRLTLDHLDEQLKRMRDSDGESVLEVVIEKSRTSTFIREVVECELKRRDQGEQLFARVERFTTALASIGKNP
jgi:hypothetical protein